MSSLILGGMLSCLSFLFGHVETMDGYGMARRVLMAVVSGGRVRRRRRYRLDGRYRLNDGGGCALMRERSERVESPGT